MPPPPPHAALLHRWKQGEQDLTVPCQRMVLTSQDTHRRCLPPANATAGLGAVSSPAGLATAHLSTPRPVESCTEGSMDHGTGATRRGLNPTQPSCWPHIRNTESGQGLIT